MKKEYAMGVIGAGLVAERIIKAVNHHSSIYVKGIYDKNPAVAAKVGKNYRLKIYSSAEELLDDNELAIIYLAVPPAYHYALAKKIFQTRKPFLCEKPLANSIQESSEMAQLAKQTGNICAMNFPTVYTKAYQKIVDLLDNDYVGRISRVEFQGYFTVWPRPWQQNDWVGKREQGGFTREVVTHYVQLMQRLVGPLENIHSFRTYPNEANKSERSLIAKANIGTIDVLINCISDIGIQEDLTFSIIGDKGVICLKNWREVWISNGDKPAVQLEIEEDNHLVYLLENLIAAMKGKEADLVDFDEGNKVHLVIEQLLGNPS